MVNRNFVLSAILLLFVGCRGGADFGQTASHGDPNLDAIERYEFAVADTSLNKLLAQDSSSPEAHYGLGFARERQLLYFDAIASYLEAVLYDPGFAQAHRGLARSYGLLGASAHALDAARKYADLMQSDIDAQLLLANAFIEANDYAAASRTVDRAASLGLDAEVANLIKARIAHLTHDFTTEQALVQQTSSKQSSSRYLSALADYLETRGLVDSAVSVSRALFSSDRQHDNLIDHFFRTLRTGYHFEARQLLPEFEKRDQSGGLAAVSRFFYDFATIRLRAAVGSADEVYRHYPGSLSGSAYSFDATFTGLDLVGSQYAATEMIQIIQQRNLAPLTDFIDYRMLVRRAPFFDPASAVYYFDSISSPVIVSEVDYQANYAYALSRPDTSGKPMPRYDSILAAQNGNPFFFAEVAAIAGAPERGKTAFADSMYRRALATDPLCLPAFLGWVEMHLWWNESQEALAAFAEYPDFAERYPIAAAYYALALAKADRPDEALALAKENLPQVAGNALLINKLARELVLREQFAQAEQIGDLAIKRYPDNPDLLAIAAFVANESEKWQDALQFTRKGLDTEASHGWLLAERARALAHSGKTDEADAIFTAAIADGSNSDALLYYSRQLAESKKDVLLAQELARQAVGAGQIHQRGMFNLAYVYLITGRYDLARGALQNALQVIKNDPEGYFLLGLALYHESKPEARDTLERAIALGLKGKMLEEAQATLNRI